MLNLGQFRVITFDCYGTLIDWESGILSTIEPVLAEHRVESNDADILKLYAEFESQAEKGEYIKYREVLRTVMREFGRRFGFAPTDWELESLEESLPVWKPFDDTVAALRVLKSRFKLGIISNVDDDLLAHTLRHLETDFDYVITAEQVGAYKPSLENFTAAINRIGLPKAGILHVAQSMYHDIVPAKQFGLATVWVNRRHSREGFGATPPAASEPDLEVPDLKTLVSLMAK
ncbi:MAG TPA: haloacid dehalogenase type II [Candidatus Deferrimicrobium sp.]|nr:haloacid dehalogenase type II [Candidatus Deferrimicrobium sp.]